MSASVLLNRLKAAKALVVKFCSLRFKYTGLALGIMFYAG